MTGATKVARTVYLAPLVVFSALFASACSSGNSDTTPTLSPESVLTEAELTEHLANANDFVRPLIEDGVVTAAEYEQAVFRVIQCLDEAGLEHSEPVLDLNRRSPRWTYGVNFRSDAELTQGAPIFEACERDYVSPVLEIWGRQDAPSESEMQAIEEAMLACLQDAGIAASSWEEANTLVQEGLLTPDQMEARQQCMVEHYVGADPNTNE